MARDDARLGSTRRPLMASPVSKHNRSSFKWRETCDGWTLLATKDLHVMQQRMPPQTSDLLHTHKRTRQLYFVLEGEAEVDLETQRVKLRPGEAIQIEPRMPHRMANRSTHELEFLVISTNAPRGDRQDLE
jgi:mannose-6-phosphate isomerase-like protein (cupin superfamily)